jgi:hypothetical protein
MQMLVYEYMSNGTLWDHLSGTPYIRALRFPFIDLTNFFFPECSLSLSLSPHPPSCLFFFFLLGAQKIFLSNSILRSNELIGGSPM